MDGCKCEGGEFGIGEARWMFSRMPHILGILSREEPFMKEALDSRAMSRESDCWEPSVAMCRISLARVAASGSLESSGGTRVSTCSDSDAFFPKICMERGSQVVVRETQTSRSVKTVSVK